MNSYVYVFRKIISESQDFRWQINVIDVRRPSLKEGQGAQSISPLRNSGPPLPEGGAGEGEKDL